MKFGLVTFTIATFEQAVVLARGVETTRESEKRTVPAADMQVAAAFAAAVDEIVQDLRNQFDHIRWPTFTYTAARQFVDAASSATKRFAFETNSRAPAAISSAMGEVRSVAGGWPAVCIKTLHIAKEVLEILNGERPVEGSSFQIASDLTADFLLKSTPVIGEAILVYEAVTGQSVIGGKNLSDSERAVSGIAAVLPVIVAAAAKYAIKGAASAFKVTRRSVVIALEYKRVYSLLQSSLRLPKAVEIAVGLRSLSPNRFKEFAELLRLSLSGAVIAEKDIARLNFFFLRMHDTAKLAQWLRIAEKELGTGVVGFQRLKGATLKPKEVPWMETLSRTSGEPVIALPELLPIDYPTGKQIPGATHPDGIWQDELFDLLVAETPSVSNAIGEIGKKQAQASTVVVALDAKGKLTRSALEQVLPGFWANPRNLAISKIIILEASGLVVHIRPERFTLPAIWALVRLGLENKQSLAQIVAELQAEPQ